LYWINVLTRESIIIHFVKENLKLLQQPDFPEEVYKKIKHNYFIEKKSVLGKPKDTEIAETSILHMIRIRAINDDTKLNHLLELPFFKKNVHDSKIFFETLKLKNPVAVVIDPSVLNNAEHRQQIEEELKNKLIAENQIDFQKEREKVSKEIEQMKKELATIPTRLEKQEYEEPKVLEEEGLQSQEWWQKLYLSADPFPLAEGLQKIDRSMYDNIIVKTKIFEKYVNYANNLRDSIFKNTIIYGEFGSGKTAFFDYLTKILLQNRILSISIPMWAVLDDQTNIYNFEEALIVSLKRECKRYGVISVEEDHKNHFHTINDILTKLTELEKFKGLVIFIDDLHKNTRAFNYVIDFLSYLQILTSSLIQSDNLKVAVYVAGIPIWKSKISTEPRLSGSLIRDESMPDISEADAFEMLNKRMATFSKNQDKKNINIIGRSFVHNVYEHLRSNYSVITFRDFLRKAIEEFGNGNFDKVLSVNPRAISSETIVAIRKIINGNPKLSIQFEQLLALISNALPENRQKCFEILGIAYLEKGILENSPQGDRNSWVFQQLERSGLLNYVQESNNVKWIINKELRETNQKILSTYGVSMEDYLIPAYIGTPLSPRRRGARSPEIIILENMVKGTTKQTEQQLLKATIQSCKVLLDIDAAQSVDIVPDELVTKCLESLSSLTRVFSTMENIQLNGRDDLHIVYLWKNFWYKSPSMIEFINQIENMGKPDLYRAHFIFGLYRDAFTDIVYFLNSQIQKDKIFSISYQDLTNEDYKIIDESRDLWLKTEYYQMCANMVQHIETKLRQHIFNILTLVYGYRDNRMKRLDPDELRKRVFTNMKKDETKDLSQMENELQYLDRKDYKILLTKGSGTLVNKVGQQNWNELFSYVFAPWSEDDLLRFLNKFADFNTAVSHNKIDSITEKHQPDLRQFILDSISFLQKLNGCYRKIINNPMIKKDNKFFFSFKPQVDNYNQHDVDVSMDEYNRLVRRMSEMEEIEVPLHDPLFIQAFYNLEYRKFVAIINLLLNIDEERMKKTGKKLVILDEMSPFFRFKLSSSLNN